MNGFLEVKKVSVSFSVLGLDSSEINYLTSGKKESETCQLLTKEKLTVDFDNPLFVIIMLTLIVYE